MYHPDPETNRQREQNMRDWRSERSRDGGGFSLPPCGCLTVVALVLFLCIGCVAVRNSVATHCTAETDVAECVKDAVGGIDLPF